VGNELELREAASMDRLSKSGRRTLQRPDTSQWIEQPNGFGTLFLVGCWGVEFWWDVVGVFEVG